MTSFPSLNLTADGFAPDPCTLTDEERDVLQRRKRKNDAYKTALCESFRRTEQCSYGEECRFAHGMDELRLPAQVTWPFCFIKSILSLVDAVIQSTKRSYATSSAQLAIASTAPAASSSIASLTPFFSGTVKMPGN